MSETDSWAIFSDAPTPSPAVESGRLDPLAEEHAQLTESIRQMHERLAEVENEIAYLFPETEGELSKTTERFKVVVSRSERWSWNKDYLEQEFGVSGMPDWIKRGFTVDKRKFQKLPKNEQDRFVHALTRKLDRAKIKVLPNV